MIGATRARLLRAPAEGWISLVLVAIMAVTVAWSLDDAALVLGRRDATTFLPWVALGGVVVGFAGARFGWGRPLAHLVGAILAALIVPILVGSVLLPHGSFQARYEATATACVNAVLDLVVRGLVVTRETGHYMLVLGLICWANGQFAAAAVFRHGRPIGPIIVLGAILIANMSATNHDYQLWFLVLFSLASLFLLTRLHALDERATWARRRIGDPATVGALYIRGGTVFVLITVFAALTLTASARSAPLAGFWEGAKPALVDISQWLQRIIPAAPDSRSLGVPSFGAQVTIGGLWSPSNDPALEIHRTPGDPYPYYWRATAYDTFTLNGWTSSTLTQTARDPGTSILSGTLDRIPEGAARTNVTFRIEPQSSFYKVAFSPIDPLTIDRPVTLDLTGTDGYFQSIAIGPSDPYTVTAAIPTRQDIPGGLTNNRLRAAGTAYPPGIVARYTRIPDGAMGPEATKLIEDIKAKAKASGHDTPFDLAEAMVTELRSDRYSYQTNVIGVCNQSSSIVECFAKYKQGYCEHYASTMAILLRHEGIPTRLVEGFLPGTLDQRTGGELVLTSSAHAWVEVYFPGYGWEMFDPTGGGVAKTVELAEGTKVPLATVPPLPSLGLGSRPPEDQGGPSRRPAGGPGSVDDQTGGTAGLMVVAAILFVSVLLATFLAWRRGPRSASTPDGVYASIAALARRFGFGPRPTQTAYEYASALGDILPSVRPELQTVATAKVEVAYGRQVLGEDRLRGLRDSYRRLRVQLLRLALRRRDRRRMR